MEERTSKHGLGLAPSAKSRKFVTLSEEFVLLWAIANVYSSEIPTKSPGMLTHPFTLANPASKSTGPSSRLSLTVGFPRLQSTVLSCWLPCSVDCPVLFWDLAFPRLLPVSREISRASPLSGFRAKTDGHPHPHHRNECHPSCHSR